MANDVDSFWQTLVAATAGINQVLAPNWRVSDSVYTAVSPDAATIGRTINIVLPADPKADVADMGVGDVSLTDIDFTEVPIVFDKHPAYSFVVRDFEQFNSPQSIRTAFLDGAIKGIKSHLNGAIAALFTTGNFSTNTAIATTGGLITTTQFLQGMAVLSDKNVPVTDSSNMSLVLGSVPYTKILGNSAWMDAQLVGPNRAENPRDTGILPTAYGAMVKLDQQMPTGSSSYTGAYFHRWAVAAASRPLPAPDGNVVNFMYLDFNGLSIRISMGYNHYPKQGWIVEIDAGYGLAVVRPEMCQLFTIAA